MNIIKSPNYSSRNQNIKCFVIHHTGGSYQATIAWFKNKLSKVSAHFVISRSGDVTQMVDVDKTAWHAGISFTDPTIVNYKSKLAQIVKDNWGINPNLYSIGIECEGYGEPFTNEQYESLSNIIVLYSKNYNIPINTYTIIGHKDISPINKSLDPKGCNFEKLINLLLSKQMIILNDELKNKLLQIRPDIVKAINEDKNFNFDQWFNSNGIYDNVYDLFVAKTQLNDTQKELLDIKNSNTEKQIVIDQKDNTIKILQNELIDLQNEIKNKESVIRNLDSIINDMQKSSEIKYQSKPNDNTKELEGYKSKIEALQTANSEQQNTILKLQAEEKLNDTITKFFNFVKNIFKKNN